MNAATDIRTSTFERFFSGQTQRDACLANMSHLLENVPGAYVCLIATLDGQPVAHVANEDWRPSRMAAIIGSLCALGETLSKEINQRGCRNVMIETDTGLSIVQRLAKPADHLILLAASNRETNLGVLLTYSRASAAAIARVAKTADAE